MRKLRISVSLILFMTLMFQTLSSVFAGVLPTTPKPSDPDNIHYFVGLFSHDIWRDSAGNWTSDGAPGDTKSISFPYNFDFPNRKIKKVNVTKFNVNMRPGNHSQRRYAEPSFTVHSYWDSSGQSVAERRICLSAPRSLRLKNEFG